jgi:hypothetical protein
VGISGEKLHTPRGTAARINAIAQQQDTGGESLRVSKSKSRERIEERRGERRGTLAV